MHDNEKNITLYTLQLDYIVSKLEEADAIFCKKANVALKYGESAPILLAIYEWFAKEAAKLVEKPAGAEFPYWAYTSKSEIELFPNESVLTLSVPRDQAIYFHIEDWSNLLRLQLLTDDADARRAFGQELASYGIKKESDIILTNFYPAQKKAVQQSWLRIFRDHQTIKNSNGQPEHMQAALWQIKREWITDIQSVREMPQMT